MKYENRRIVSELLLTLVCDVLIVSFSVFVSKFHHQQNCITKLKQFTDSNYQPKCPENCECSNEEKKTETITESDVGSFAALTVKSFIIISSMLPFNCLLNFISLNRSFNHNRQLHSFYSCYFNTIIQQLV